MSSPGYLIRPAWTLVPTLTLFFAIRAATRPNRANRTSAGTFGALASLQGISLQDQAIRPDFTL